MAILKPLIQKLWASGGAVVQPSDTKIETGWTAEVPPHQWENWIQNRQDQYLAHINERGIPEWDGSTDYLASGKSYVQGSDGVIYVSVAASGPSTTVQDPTTDSTDTYWKSSFEVASAAQAQALTDNTKQITPLRLGDAFKGSNQSLTENGYQRLPGGLIIQWGSAATVAGRVTVTWPIAFPNECISAVGNHHGAGGAIVILDAPGTPALSATTGKFAVTNLFNSVSSTTYSFQWLAIGW